MSVVPFSSPSLPSVCVIGGGIVGCSTTFFLSQTGVQVTLLERGTIGSHASGVNFGGVRRHARAEAELPIAMRSHRLWPRLKALIGHDCDLETPGHLKLAFTEAEMAVLEDWLPVGRSHGLEAQLLSPADLAISHPRISPHLAGASFLAGDGFANPRFVSPGLARAARANGARVVENCEVSALERSGSGWAIHGTNGIRITADVVVCATGAWSGPALDPWLEELPVTPAAPQMFVTEPVPVMKLPVLGVVSGGIYLRQSVRGNLIFGGGRGTIAEDGLRSRPGEQAFLETPALLARLLPGCAHVPLIRSWTGIEGHTPDGLPVIGPSSLHEGLFLARAFCGHGFQMGLGVGETLAELITTGQTATDLAAFRPDRFLVDRSVPRDLPNAGVTS